MANLEGDIVEAPRFDKIRKFNLYYLAFVSFGVAYGRVFSLDWLSFGKHPENALPIPILLTLYLFIHERAYKWPITYREKVFIAYAFFISLTPFWGLYLDTSLSALKEFWAAAGFGILIMYNTRSEKDINLLIFPFLFGVFFKSIIYNVNYSIPNEVIRSILVQKYGSAAFLLAPMSICLGLFFYWANGAYKKVLLFCIFIVLFFSLLHTLNRGALIAFIFAITLFFLIFNKKFAFVTVFLAAIIAVIIYVSPNSLISERIMSIKWQAGSLQVRVQEIFPAAIVIYKDHNPIWGIGSGSFATVASSNPKYRSMISEEPTHAHNIFLQALVTQGVLGAAMSLFFVFQMVSMSSYLLKTSASPFIKAIGAAGFIWITGIVVAGLANHEFHNSRFNMGAGLVITVIVLSYYISIQNNTSYNLGQKCE